MFSVIKILSIIGILLVSSPTWALDGNSESTAAVVSNADLEKVEAIASVSASSTLTDAKESTVKEEIRSLAGTTIIGNAEFPKITYALPWKIQALEATAIRPPMPKSLALTYIDREHLLQEVQWHHKRLQRNRIKNRQK